MAMCLLTTGPETAKIYIVTLIYSLLFLIALGHFSGTSRMLSKWTDVKTKAKQYMLKLTNLG